MGSLETFNCCETKRKGLNHQVFDAKRLIIAIILTLLGVLVFVPVAQAQTLEDQEAVVCTCFPDLPTLTLKDPPETGPMVTALQEQLLKLGLNPGTVDGSFGPSTSDAVKVFQILRGLQPTGEVTPEVWQEIYRALGDEGYEDTDPEAETSFIIDRGTRTLTVLIGGKFHKQYRVAVGKPETPTPLGDWRIVHRSTNWGSGFGTRWMGLNVPWGIYGVHGTNKPYSIGSYASHGCIRMFNNSVEEVYPLTRVGNLVRIIDTRQPALPKLSGRKLKEGMSGQEIVYLQWHLKAHGIPVSCDGRFGPWTTWALQYFQTLYCLPASGEVDEATYQTLNEFRDRYLPTLAS
ncbi:MAG: L,D-transpeptidase family protein [Syntrophomonadales bacterium]|jgi:peptidoglycan hydrolase-like protein with peptidoglycan-binding domain